jgi:hypothetical protein
LRGWVGNLLNAVTHSRNLALARTKAPSAVVSDEKCSA